MRVGILTDAFPPELGGIQIFADQFVTRLAQSESVDHVEVLAFTEGSDEKRPDVSIHRVGASQTPMKILTGLTWFRRQEVDVVHSLTLYPSGLIAALCNRLSDDVSTYATVHGLDAMSVVDHPILGSVHRFIFQELDEVLFNSDSTRNKTHSAYYMDFPSRRIYPGAPAFNDDGDNQSVNTNHTEDSFVVLTVARLVERKGIDDLVDAIADLNHVELWVVGDGPERSALERRVPDDAEDRVTFFGEVDQSSLAQLYRSADAFCLPSVYLRSEGDIEGLGLVFLEAQQFGLPVIGTRSGGIPEAFDDGETGFLVDERSPDQIRERIATLRDDSELYRSFSERAQTFVQQEFSWESCIQNHLDAYDP